MITCTCHGVKSTALIQTVATGLNPALPVSDLSGRLRAGSDCGTCIPNLHELIAQNSPPDFIRATRQIHKSDRRFLLFADQKILSQVDLEPVQQRCYVVVNGASDLREIQNDTNLNFPSNLFGLALGHSRILHLNENELPLSEWLQSLDEHSVFSPWDKITKGQFRKWSPDKINRTTLLRFLTSELMYARRIAAEPQLSGVISVDAVDEAFKTPQHKLVLGVPRFNFEVGSEFNVVNWLEEVHEIMNK